MPVSKIKLYSQQSAPLLTAWLIRLEPVFFFWDFLFDIHCVPVLRWSSHIPPLRKISGPQTAARLPAFEVPVGQRRKVQTRLLRASRIRRRVGYQGAGSSHQGQGENMTRPCRSLFELNSYLIHSKHKGCCHWQFYFRNKAHIKHLLVVPGCHHKPRVSRLTSLMRHCGRWNVSGVKVTESECLKCCSKFFI